MPVYIHRSSKNTLSKTDRIYIHGPTTLGRGASRIAIEDLNIAKAKNCFAHARHILENSKTGFFPFSGSRGQSSSRKGKAHKKMCEYVKCAVPKLAYSIRDGLFKYPIKAIKAFMVKMEIISIIFRNYFETSVTTYCIIKKYTYSFNTYLTTNFYCWLRFFEIVGIFVMLLL